MHTHTCDSKVSLPKICTYCYYILNTKGTNRWTLFSYKISSQQNWGTNCFTTHKTRGRLNILNTFFYWFISENDLFCVFTFNKSMIINFSFMCIRCICCNNHLDFLIIYSRIFHTYFWWFVLIYAHTQEIYFTYDCD